jgi:CheY-like chemotaxis protein
MSAYQILVVDDDEDIRAALIELLEDSGYRAVGAAHGSAALEHLRECGEPPCVILLDLSMPVMDGWEFRAEQRRDPSLAAIPVVVISAYRDRPSVTELDAAAYLNKPVDAAALLEVIRRHCRGAEGGRGARV